jgi:hypothetical protein
MNSRVKVILAYLTLYFIFFKFLKMKFEVQGMSSIDIKGILNFIFGGKIQITLLP